MSVLLLIKRRMNKSQHPNSKKLILRTGFAVLLLLFFARTANAQVSHCEQEKNVIRKDQCYLDNARSVEDCEPIYSSLTKGECIEKNAQSIEDCLKIEKATASQSKCIEKFLANFTELSRCDSLSEKYQAECYANVTYNNHPDEISKCYDLSSEHQDECIAVYIKRKEISDPSYCFEIKTELQKECAYWASFNRYFDASSNKPKAGVSKEECDQYQGEVKKGCIRFFNSVGIFTIFGLGLVVSVIIFLFLPALLFAAIITVVVIIVRRRHRKRSIARALGESHNHGTEKVTGKSQPSKSNNTILKIVLAILALILISGTAYVDWRIWEDIPEFQDYEFYHSFIEHRELAELQKENMSNWKTYRNEKYGFEFKYPFHLQPQSTLFADAPFHRHVGDLIVMPFSDGKNDELIVAASDHSLDGYIIQDFTQGVFYRFDQQEDRWISSVRGEITGEEPKLLNTPFTAYGYRSWERACSWQGAIVPHPKDNVVLEIIYTSCIDDEGQQSELLEAVPNLNLNRILYTFCFINK